jgi:antitoxin (DNA-binding transcriptional repressor) of toxin-antitoxin stability system
MQVNILDAKTQFSSLIAAVQAGEEVIIANRGKPVAQLVLPKQKPHKTKGFGLFKKMGLPPPAEDWDSPAVNKMIHQTLVEQASREPRLIEP